jgi:hypothetical protein
LSNGSNRRTIDHQGILPRKVENHNLGELFLIPVMGILLEQPHTLFGRFTLPLNHIRFRCVFPKLSNVNVDAHVRIPHGFDEPARIHIFNTFYLRILEQPDILEWVFMPRLGYHYPRWHQGEDIHLGRVDFDRM